MNTVTLSLSSSATSQTSTRSTLSLNDHTTLFVNLTGASELLLPTNLSINWGDGTNEVFENDILQTENLIIDRYSSIFFDNYSHEYYPSDSTLSKNLTAIFTIKYINNDYSIFNIPMVIANYNYSTAIGDMYLLNTVIQPDDNNSKIHQFVTKKGGYIVELTTK